MCMKEDFDRNQIDIIRQFFQFCNISGQHVICVTPKLVEEHLKSSEYKRPRLVVDKDCIKWTPPKKTVKAKKNSLSHA